jgi:hypothetical protein
MSTCSYGKKSIRGSDCGASSISRKKEIPNNGKMSDVSSVSEIQEMAFTLSGFHHYPCYPLPSSMKKGPSSIKSFASVKTSTAQCPSHIT